MQNGFYFKDNLVRADYFLLQKIKLIQMQSADNQFDASVLHLNETKYSFCSLFDYSEESEFILIFNNLSEDDYSLIPMWIANHQHRSRQQKILFVGHILFDYRKVLEKLMAVIDPRLIYVLVDNSTNPFLVPENELSSLKNINILVYQNQTQNRSKSQIKKIFNLTVVAKTVLFYFLKLFLKPVQSIKDFYATYNYTFFYGKLRAFSIKACFTIRHFSVMSVIRSFYGSKVLLIRLFYKIYAFVEWSSDRPRWCYYRICEGNNFLYNFIKLGSIKLFYFVRHLSVMSVLRSFYGSKVLLIRSFYKILALSKWCSYRPQWCYYRLCEGYNFTFNLLKLGLIKMYYSLRHISVMSVIRSFYGSKVLLIRSFYKILALSKWCSYRPRWCYYRLCEGYNFIYNFTKLGLIRIFYSVRHMIVMSMIYSFYGTKVFLIRSFYKILAVVPWLKDRFLWCYFRLGWISHRILWGCHKILRFGYQIHDFNLNYTLYPFRKIFWILSFQFQKRILRKA